MNLLGKIFVVLNFVLTLVFMTFAVCLYGMHRNWRLEAVGADGKGGYWAKLETAYKEKAEKDRELEAKQKQEAQLKAEHRQALAKLESELAARAKENADLKTTNTQLAASERKAIEELKTSNDEKAKFDTENKGLRQQISVVLAARDKVFTENVAVTEQVNKANGEITRLNERNKQLVEDLSGAKLLLAKLETPLGTPIDLHPPRLAGEITNVNGDTLVEFSLGSDDGIRAGHQILIYRENKFLARAQVIRTTPNQAVAKIDVSTRTAPVQQGDRMSTDTKS